MKYLYIILALTILSCNSEKRMYRKCVKYAPYCVKSDSSTTSTTDSTKQAVAPDTIRIKGETIVLENPCAILCDSFGNIRKGFIRTSRTKDNIVTTIREVNGNLESDCDVDGYIHANDSLLIIEHKLRTTIKNTVPVALPENKLQKAYRLTAWFTWLSIVLVVLFIVFRKSLPF